MEEVTTTLYRLGKCGFYLDDQHEFADLKAVFRGFNRWAKSLGSIGESSTYTPSEDDEFLRAFCIDIRQLAKRDSWLLVTWNELEHSEEGVQVVAMQSQIGQADVSTVDVDALNLPGYPAYYYIDAVHEIIVNFRFDQRLNGSRQFQRFILGFLTSSSEWCVWNEDDDEELLGYADDEDIVDGVEPAFSTHLARLAGRVDYIRENFDLIRKVIRRASVNPRIEEHKSFLDSAFGLLGMPVNNRLKAEIAFQYEFKTRFTPDKLDSVINEYNAHVDSPWDDVGFTFARDSSKVHWLSGGIARDKSEIDIGRLESGMVDVEGLVAYLNDSIDVVVGRLNEEA